MSARPAQLSDEQVEQGRAGDDTREAAAGDLPKHGGGPSTLQVLGHAADSPPGSVFPRQLTKALAVPMFPDNREQAWQQGHNGGLNGSTRHGAASERQIRIDQESGAEAAHASRQADHDLKQSFHDCPPRSDALMRLFGFRTIASLASRRTMASSTPSLAISSRMIGSVRRSSRLGSQAAVSHLSISRSSSSLVRCSTPVHAGLGMLPGTGHRKGHFVPPVCTTRVALRP